MYSNSLEIYQTNKQYTFLLKTLKYLYFIYVYLHRMINASILVVYPSQDIVNNFMWMFFFFTIVLACAHIAWRRLFLMISVLTKGISNEYKTHTYTTHWSEKRYKMRECNKKYCWTTTLFYVSASWIYLLSLDVI